MSCIMRSQAISLVQQQHYGRPKNLANYRPAEPSHNIKILGSALHWVADMEGFSEASLGGLCPHVHECILLITSKYAKTKYSMVGGSK